MKNRRQKNRTFYKGGALREAESFIGSEITYKILFKKANDGIFLVRDGKFYDCNDKSLVLLRMEKDDLIGLAPVDISPEYQADGRLSSEKAKEILAQIEAGQSLVFEWVYQRGGGELIDVEITINKVEIPGKGTVLFNFMRDISERKAAEKMLREGDARFRAVMDQVPAVVSIVDEQSHYQYGNQFLLDMLHTTADQLAGSTREQFFKKETSEILNELDKKVISEKAVVQLPEIPMQIGKDVKYFQGIKYPITMVDGTLCAGTFAMDITEQKKVVDKFKENEEKLRAVFYHHYQLTGLLDIDGRLLDLNETALNMVGAKESDVVGKKFWETPWWAHSEVLQGAVKDAIVKAGAGNLVRFETTHPDSKGGLRNIDFSINPILDETGKVKYLAVEGLDITDLKMAEEALRLAKYSVDKSQTAIFWVKPDARVFYANDAACKSLGYSREELLKMSVPDFDPLWSHAYWHQKGWKRLKKTGFSIFESTHRRKDGTEFPVDIVTSAVDFEGEEYLFTFATDITERRSAEEERAKLHAQLQNTQKMEAIGTLAGGIAHDFNNILSAIIGYADMIEMYDVPKDSPGHAHIKEVLAAAARAKGLVRQILAFSRKDEQELQPVQLSILLKETLKFLRASLPTTIEISKNIESKRGMVLCDPTQMHQVMMNLCTNAAYAMRENGGILKVSLTETEVDGRLGERHGQIDSNSYLKLSVSDTGEGMTLDVIEHIFDPYFTTKPKGEGTGLGLAVVHGIVKNMGGGIDVESELGKGTTFHVLIPLAQGNKAGFQPEMELAIPRGKERVLLVDDEKTIVEMGRQHLEGLGYDVVATIEATEALETFRKNPNRFDLVITDMTMPKMTGAELAHELMNLRANLPVILCSGFSDIMTLEKAKAMGFKGFMMKPFSARDLAESIRSVLDGKEKK